MAMRLLDLFSGIGGFSYAAETLIGGYETVAFCEMDEFCQKVLKKHWPQVPIFNDVRTLDAARLGRIDIVTGGYPCQPFSQAGRRQGEEDERHLWPEMLRIIKSCQPRYVVAENVAGHVTMGLDQVLTDLEDQGYTTRPIIVPACAKNAPHRRDRVWIIGQLTTNTNDTGNRTSRSYIDQEQRTIEQGWKEQSLFEFSRHDEAMADSDKWQSRSGDESKSDETQQFEFSTDNTSERGIVADSSSERRRISHDNTEFPKRVQQQFSDRSGIVEKKSGENVANSDKWQSRSGNESKSDETQQFEFSTDSTSERGIVANSDSIRCRGGSCKGCSDCKRQVLSAESKGREVGSEVEGCSQSHRENETVTNTDNEGLQGHGKHRQVEREHGQRQSTKKNIPHGKEEVLANTSGIGQSRSRKSVEPISSEENKTRKTSGSDDGSQRGKHDGNIEQRVGDTADGISTGLLRHFDREPEHIPRVTKGEKDRAKKLKALGNSIVPQVAAEILLAIRISEESV